MNKPEAPKKNKGGRPSKYHPDYCEALALRKAFPAELSGIVLHKTREVAEYVNAAWTMTHLHLGIAGLGVLAGLRKQEMIALRWRHVDYESHALEIADKYIQASKTIVRGTKRGEEVTRFVPMSDELEEILLHVHRRSRFKGPGDFVLADEDGKHLSPKLAYLLHRETCEKAEVDVTVHGLRHTFGREFASRSENFVALKDILGHSNIVVTQRYAELGKERLQSFRDVVSYKDFQRQKSPRKANR